MERRCYKCASFTPVSKGGGVCKANPPVPMIFPSSAPSLDPRAMSAELRGVFPPVSVNEWCSRFEPADAPVVVAAGTHRPS